MNWFEDSLDYYGANCFKGMELAYPHLWQCYSAKANSATLMKREQDLARVAIVISGGGSDGPLLPAFVGEGLADACVVGAPYSAPNAYALYEAGKYLGREKGVLFLYNNFAGDYLNNDMAQELLRLEAYDVSSVAATDDIGTARGEVRDNRGGRMALPYLVKIAANCITTGMDLAEATAIVRRANSRMATVCVVVDQQKGTIGYGNGFSGEPPFLIETHMDAYKTAKKALSLILDDITPKKDEKLALLLNRLRLTSYSDSYHMAHRVHSFLKANYEVAQMRVGAFSNILDAYGYTFTLLCVDNELEEYIKGAVATDCFLL